MGSQKTGMPVRSEADADERLLSKIVDFTTPAQGMEVDTDNDAHVKAKLRDDAGDPFGTADNPVNVSVVNAQNGDGVVDYNTEVDLAKDGSITHTYAITAAKTGKVLRLSASASGKILVTFAWGAAAAAVTTMVMHNSVASPQAEFIISAEVLLAATNEIEVTITNLDNLAMDVHSVIQVQEF